MQDSTGQSSGARELQATVLLERWSSGDAGALAELMPLVYADLRRLADRSLRRERDDHTLQATALVHEAYLRMQRGKPLVVDGRDRFLHLAARLMRQVLVDHARRVHAGRRDGGPRVSLLAAEHSGDEALLRPSQASVDFLALHAALERLAERDVRKAQVMELRFFGGYEVAEVARLLGVSEPTVIADTRLARAWLLHQLQDSRPA